ncbi:hypothetical protein VTJ49DRAFT_714 [Mycothermus thermophilus]|uniref:Methyltransferase type 12 domain-containing protein n=1 Tax=Humicola insolens TaxID=85995 RepID=A0ABR3VEL1_HUMIN
MQVKNACARRASLQPRTPRIVGNNNSTTTSLDEQHAITTQILGFLLHPFIPPPSPTAKIADVGTGTAAWLLDLARSLPPTCQFTGFDVTPSGFPHESARPKNVTFKLHDMFVPFPEEEHGNYDVVAVRFVSSATRRGDFARAVGNLVKLLKPGGWLQWIDSVNFGLYCGVAGLSREACQEVYEGLEPFRSQAAGGENGKGEDDGGPVIGLFVRDAWPSKARAVRERVFQEQGLVDVHEDVFSTDRLQKPELRLREKGTRNIMDCFLGCLGELVGVEGSGWTKERLDALRVKVMREIDGGVYHTLDQVCLVGRRPEQG